MSDCTNCWEAEAIDHSLKLCDPCKAWHLLQVAWGKKFPDLPMPRNARIEDVLDVVLGTLEVEAIVDGR